MSSLLLAAIAATLSSTYSLVVEDVSKFPLLMPKVSNRLLELELDLKTI